ncbi:MAG: O-antigen translocase [Prevotella sp.]|nr:O-antigen translocase [Prevotella sp.]
MDKQNSSYRQIVRSTSIFGGAQVINTLIGIVRNKLGALLIGTDGIGLVGAYQNIIDLIRLVSNMGINTGGVRDIVSNSDNSAKQGQAVSVFRWWLMLTSCLGALLCLVLCRPISIWGFGDGGYAVPIAALSAAVFFISLSNGQSAVLQGMRLITQMAKANLYGNIAGLIVCITAYCFWGLKGIVPSFILSSVFLYFFTARYARKIRGGKIPAEQALKQGLPNLRLGLYIAGVGIVGTASMFFVRSFLSQQADWNTVGIFNAAWTISFTYPALILQSMGSDYFPRLCSVIRSAEDTCKLVNEQTYIALVVITPVVVMMMLFSKYVLQFFYSSEFMLAALLLQWQIVGGFFKVLSWPLAFILLAKGKGRYHLLAEIAFYAVYLGVGYVLFMRYGLVGLGVGYLAAYLVYLPIVYIFGLRLCSFRWTRQNILMIVYGILFVAAAIVSQLCVAADYRLPTQILLSLLVAAYAFFMLNKAVNIKELIRRIGKN